MTVKKITASDLQKMIQAEVAKQLGEQEGANLTAMVPSNIKEQIEESLFHEDSFCLSNHLLKLYSQQQGNVCMYDENGNMVFFEKEPKAIDKETMVRRFMKEVGVDKKIQTISEDTECCYVIWDK